MRHTLIAISLIVLLVCSVQAATLEIGTLEDYTTINAALAAANPGDTLRIHWESGHPVYTEHVVLDESITLTSTWTPGSDPDERPMIRSDLTVYNDIISIEADGVTISNLRIQNSKALESASGDELDMTNEIGILITESDCIVSHCEVTRCRVGILLKNTGVSTLNNVIDSCQIGALSTAKWFNPSPSSTHDGNFFGIVQVDPIRTVASYPVGEYKPDRITNCTIARNRFYGVVLRGGSMANVMNNLIVWNGTDISLSGANHYGDGGILCLFTDDEMALTDVSVQSPMIMSNTIYGNDGFQVCVITDDPGREPRRIANAPVLMSNIIGPDTMVYPSGTPTSVPNWLVSCTSESTAAASTPQHGSAPVMAFNNLYRPDATGSDQKYFAHPGNPTPTPGTPTSPPASTPTPTPTGTLFTPAYSWSPTPGPGTPGYGTRTPASTFTAISTRTPTPAMTGTPNTPTAGPYMMDEATWSIRNTFGDPRFVGGSTIEAFDFHLRDPVFQITPTPGAPRSEAFDSGGLRLNPGSTRSDHVPDIGQSDIGAHYYSNVPSVSDLTCTIYGQEQGFQFQWVNPERYADNRLFSDHAGNIVYCASVSGQDLTILSQVYIDPCQSYTIARPPDGTDQVGVVAFNTAGAQSSVVWVDLCD